MLLFQFFNVNSKQHLTSVRTENKSWQVRFTASPRSWFGVVPGSWRSAYCCGRFSPSTASNHDFSWQRSASTSSTKYLALGHRFFRGAVFSTFLEGSDGSTNTEEMIQSSVTNGIRPSQCAPKIFSVIDFWEFWCIRGNP